MYLHHSANVYSIEEVLNAIVTPPNCFVQYAIFAGRKINVASRRMQTFKLKGVNCYLCGLVSTHFLLVTTDNKSYKLVLLNHAEVEFTQDHIYPTSLGGYNHMDNARTLCVSCNSRKSSMLEYDFIMKELHSVITHKLSPINLFRD